jgi:hypothetical protein
LWASGREGLNGSFGHLLVLGAGVGHDGEACAVEDVEAEVAAAFGPLVVLFGQDGANPESPDAAGSGAGSSRYLSLDSPSRRR